MQITNLEVRETSKDGIYNQIKPPLVGEHAFPLTGFLCKSAQVTKGRIFAIIYRESSLLG